MPVGDHGFARHLDAGAEQVHHRLRVFVHQGVLVGRVAAHTNAYQGDGDVVAQKARQHAAVRARAA
jgi:hypothetical protein